MRKLISLTSLLIVLMGVAMLSGSYGCANIIPPTGGPRDSLPPVLVSALPKDSALNFTAKKIVITFNEYIQLDNNMNDNLIVSPYPVSVPIVEGKLRTVSVLLRDSLKPNTTYSINFGKGIKDVNEGNIAKNLVYVFSTGDHLDKGTLSGNVMIAETGKKDTTLLVVLHNNLDDTSIRKNSPIYITRLDSGGNFRFRFIAPGTYNAFVLPNDYSKKYDDSTKMFAFLNAPVTIDSNLQTVKFLAYRQAKPAEKKQFSTPVNNKKKPVKDTAALKMTTGLSNSPQDLLQPFVFSFTKKIGAFDSTKIVLSDTNFVPVKGVSFSPDSALTNYSLHYTWKENTAYKIVVQRKAFKDTLGNELAKIDTVSFKTRRESEYGSLRLFFDGLDLSRNPVLLLLQSEKIIISAPLTSKEWYREIFKPGEYQIKLLYDTNKNGVWDAGNYDKKLQPEQVDAIPRKLIIKANIDNDVQINL